MTIAQIITLALAGPLGLMCLAKLIVTLAFEEVRDFEIVHAAILVLATIAILVAFLGIK